VLTKSGSCVSVHPILGGQSLSDHRGFLEPSQGKNYYLITYTGSLEHDERIKGGPQWASPRSYNKWVGKRCMNSTDLAAVLCHSVQRAIRSAPSRTGT